MDIPISPPAPPATLHARVIRLPYAAHLYTCDAPACATRLLLPLEVHLDREAREARLPDHGWSATNGRHLCAAHRG